MFAIAFAALFDFMYTLSRNRTIGEGFRVRLWLLRSLQASAQGIKKAKQAFLREGWTQEYLAGEVALLISCTILNKTG
jgi:hypothetical protein